VTEPDTLPVLLSGQRVSLASWFASPLSRQQAETWLPKIRRRAQNALNGAQDGSAVPLAELIVQYWLGRDVGAIYQNRRALAGGHRERAMLELCYGQLLMACKIDIAWQHLDRGFELAAHILQPEDYFLVLKRHERLRALALSAQPSKPMHLDELLAEAAVIQQLKGAGRGTHRLTSGQTHLDTVD
jgi:hypothetical protein